MLDRKGFGEGDVFGKQRRLRPDSDYRGGYLPWSMSVLRHRITSREFHFEILYSLAVLSLYCSNRLLGIRDSILPQWFCDGHFGDFCGGLLFPAYVNAICIATDSPFRVIGIGKLLLLGLVCAVFWEGLAPLLLSYSVADAVDCLCYVAGCQLYGMLRHLLLK